MKTIANYVFFWKSPLGQWNMLPFVDNEGVEYNCAEQYMMAKKALLFGDFETYALIMKTEKPSHQQDLGRLVKNFNQKVWDANAVTIVYQGNIFKFQQNPELLELLMSTGDKTLVEASPFDLIWGIGYGEDVEERIICDPSQWRGQNLLGYTLTNLRDNFFKQK